MITYDGIHPIRIKNKSAAWNAGNEFISRISHELVEDKFFLDFYLGQKDARKHLLKLFQKFGLFRVVNFSGFKELKLRWKISKNSVPEAIKLMDSLSNLPEHWFGPHLYRQGKFLLRDLNSNERIDGQKVSDDFDDDHGHKTSISNFRLNFRKKVSISIWLVLPFNDNDSRFNNYIQRLCEIAPFKISGKQWRKWEYTRNNTLKCNKINVNINNISSKS